MINGNFKLPVASNYQLVTILFKRDLRIGKMNSYKIDSVVQLNSQNISIC